MRAEAEADEARCGLQFDEKLEVIQVSLRDRMRFYKLRVTPDAATKGATFNEQLKPELIPEQNDPFCVDWIHDVAAEPYYVGEKVRPGVFLTVSERGLPD